jgi:hypothetical protein
MSQITKGPLPPEEAAKKEYAKVLYAQLQSGYAWHDDALALLREQYQNFVWTAAYTFGVQSMWDYAELVKATHKYLRSKGSPALWAEFRNRVHSGIAAIDAQLKGIAVDFDDQERVSMGRAYDLVGLFLKKW